MQLLDRKYLRDAVETFWLGFHKLSNSSRGVRQAQKRPRASSGNRRCGRSDSGPPPGTANLQHIRIINIRINPSTSPRHQTLIPQSCGGGGGGVYQWRPSRLEFSPSWWDRAARLAAASCGWPAEPPIWAFLLWPSASNSPGWRTSPPPASSPRPYSAPGAPPRRTRSPPPATAFTPQHK